MTKYAQFHINNSENGDKTNNKHQQFTKNGIYRQ